MKSINVPLKHKNQNWTDADAHRLNILFQMEGGITIPTAVKLRFTLFCHSFFYRWIISSSYHLLSNSQHLRSNSKIK